MSKFLNNAIKYYKNYKRVSKLRKRGAKIGNNVVISKACKFDNPNKLVIGDNVYIGNNFYSNCEGGLIIGSGTIISYNCTIMTYNHDYKEDLFMPYGLSNIHKEVVIKERVWIGINVSITGGVTIGENAIIGMGTTVAKEIPSGSIFAGGRFISEREEKNYKYDLLSVRTVYNPVHLFKFNRIMNKIKKSNKSSDITFDIIKKYYNDYDHLSMIYRWCEEKNIEIDWHNEIIKIK